MRCGVCGSVSDVTKYSITPTYSFFAQSCGHRHFIDTKELYTHLKDYELFEQLVIREMELNLERPRNYPTGEGRHEE